MIHPSRAFSFGLLAVLLAAFIGTTAGAAPITLQFYGHPTQIAALQPIIDEFNAGQNRIVVEIVRKDANPNVVVAQHLAGLLPDLIESAGTYTQQYARKGMMADLTPFLAREPQQYLADFITATMPQNTVEGRIYSLPAFLQIEGMYYNPEVLANAGLHEPEPGWTWDDLRRSAMKAVRKEADGKFATWGITAGHVLQFDMVWLGQANGRFITDDLQLPADTQIIRTTYNYILSMINEDILRYRGLGINTDGPTDNTTWGFRTAFVADATYRQNTWVQIASPLRTAPPLRYNTASTASSMFTDRSWAIMNVTPERQAAAWEIIKYITRTDNAARFAVSLGYPPATRSAIAHSEFRSYLRNNVNMQRWVDWYTVIEDRTPWPPEARPVNDNTVVPQVTQLLKKTISMDQFLSNLQQLVPQAIKEQLQAN